MPNTQCNPVSRYSHAHSTYYLSINVGYFASKKEKAGKASKRIKCKVQETISMKQLNVRSNLRYMLSLSNALKLNPVNKRSRNGRRRSSSSQSSIARFLGGCEIVHMKSPLCKKLVFISSIFQEGRNILIQAIIIICHRVNHSA
jgi:hypothetical protein